MQSICTLVVEILPSNPCNPSPCGPNAACREHNGAGSCSCLPEFHGDPYVGCRPECLMSSECSFDKACLNMKCVDPCPGSCGINAECHVINHIPECSCLPGFTGDALSICKEIVICKKLMSHLLIMFYNNFSLQTKKNQQTPVYLHLAVQIVYVGLIATDRFVHVNKII